MGGGVPPSPEGKKKDRVLRGRTEKSSCFKAYDFSTISCIFWLHEWGTEKGGASYDERSLCGEVTA